MTMTFEQALDVALVEVKDSYAQSYLQNIDVVAAEYGIEGIRVQLLYCLNNMQHYRGETARQVKAAFRAKIRRLEVEELELKLKRQ